MSLLGIDIGSGSTKAVVFDAAGAILASASQGYQTYSPAPNRVEIDPELFWNAVVQVTREVAAQVSDPIVALAISSHGETIIPLDKQGKVAAPALMNADNRATEEAQWWADTFGRERIYEITGLPLHAMFGLNKILWQRKHDPELFEKVDRYVCVGDYILTKMGLPPYIDYTLACRTMAFDIRTKTWSEEILAHAGLSADRLSIPQPSGAIAGKLSAEVAALLGLQEGVIVALGGHDQPCGALGAGVIDAGEVSDSAGTYECMAAVSAQPVNTPQALTYSLNSYCHVVPDRYVTLAFFPAGVAQRWFLDQFCFEDKYNAEQKGISLYEELNEKITALDTPTGLCITPHFVGSCNPYWDVRATGVMSGLTPQLSRHQVYKAIFEGIASELALNIEVLEEIIGRFDGIKINGGNSRAPWTVQLRADLSGKRFVTLHTAEAVCQGAALLAGIAAGVYRDAADAVAQTVRVDQEVNPNTASVAAYARQYAQYRELYLALERVRAL